MCFDSAVKYDLDIILRGFVRLILPFFPGSVNVVYIPQIITPGS